MCHEILALSSTFTEASNRVFDNSTYRDVLSRVAIKLTADTSDTDNTSGVIDTLSRLTSFIFDKGGKITEEYTVDYVLLDDNVVGALTGDQEK